MRAFPACLCHKASEHLMINTDLLIVDAQQACVQSSTIPGVTQRNGVSLSGWL